MKLTEEAESTGEESQLIVERSLKQKEKGQVEAKFDEMRTVKQPEMTEDDSVVSAGGDGERKEFEMKMLLRRQEAERKMLKNKINEDTTVDGLIQGVKDCCIDKEDKKDEEDLSGKLSHLSLKTSSKRQEPREDDERGDNCPQTEDEGKEKTDIVHEQQWATLDEPTPLQEPTDEEVDKNKKAVPRKPINGLAVFPNRAVANNAFNQQQMGHNDPNSLAWIQHCQQQQQQQQALRMPQNFPNYQGFQQQDQYNNVSAGTGPMHHSKRGYDFETQDMYSDVPKYIRPPQMPQNNLDAPDTPISPTSFNKPVSTVCTKQMAGATLLQQTTPPAPMLSPTQQQPQLNWDVDYPLHHQPQQHHHQQQQPRYPNHSFQHDFGFLDEALNITDENVVGDAVDNADDEPDFDFLLANDWASHKGREEAITQKDLDPILSLSNGCHPQQQCYIPNSSSPPAAVINNNNALNMNTLMNLQKNSQEDMGYATDQSPSHDSQFSPSPQSVMAPSPSGSSHISTSPPANGNFSPPPSNFSQDSGVCSPMSEDGKSYGQIKSPRSVPRAVTENNFISEMASPPHYNTSIIPPLPQMANDAIISSQAAQQHQEMIRDQIVPPLPDSMLRLDDIDNLDEAFNFNGNSQSITDFLDSRQEELNDVVSVLEEDVRKMIQKTGISSQQQPQQQNQLEQSHLIHQQPQIVQQQSTIVTNPAGGRGVGFVSQVQQTTNFASNSGGVMLKNNCHPVVPMSAQPPSAMTSSRPVVIPATTISNNKIMQAPPATNVKTMATPVYSSAMPTPSPNAEGKLPIPPTPRRSQNVTQKTTPMLGFPNNGQMTTLIVLNPAKPRLQNIAPKDPTKHTANAANGVCNNNNNNNNNNNMAVNNKNIALNTAANNNNGNMNASCPSNSSPAMQQVQPVVANGNPPNPPNPPPNGNAMPPQQNGIRRIITKRLNAARKLVAKLVRDDLEYADGEGDTNLHVAVCRTDRTDPYLIQALLERLQRENLTSIINAQNNAGQTPLYLAVSSNDPNKVKVFVDKGADVTLYAETRGYNGAKEKMAAIHCASSRGQGYLDTLKALLTAPGIQVDQLDSQGHTALHCAILCHGTTRGDNQQINSLPIIETLVMAGAGPNLQVQNGRTALMFALETGSLDVFEKLFSMVKPENRERCLRTQDVKGNSVLKIAERLKANLPPPEQQRLHNCLRRSIYQRSNGLMCTNVNTASSISQSTCS